METMKTFKREKGETDMKSKLVNSCGGKVRVIEGFRKMKRVYVRRTSARTYVVTTSQALTLNTMLEIAGEYHFGTLKELHAAIAAETKQTKISIMTNQHHE